MKKYLILLILFAGGFFAACHRQEEKEIPQISKEDAQPVVIKESIARINIVDQNGLSETITSQERLKDFKQKNFFDPQPYKKVLRIYMKDKGGLIRSLITSYYDNGQIRQYLECVNGRASGLYEEWYQNGKKKLLAHVIAGKADLDEKAFDTWSFQGKTQAWNETGELVACFTYDKGVLQGKGETYFPSGALETESSYVDGLKEGCETFFREDGSTIQTISYQKGKRHGPSCGFWNSSQKAWEEEYENDRLKNGKYFLQNQDLISSVENGTGIRSLIDGVRLVSQRQIQDGKEEGWVKIFDKEGLVEERYEMHQGKKNGEEIHYFNGGVKPRFSLEWKDGIISGISKTWYPNGVLESKKEMCQNMKQGMSTAWYSDGSTMLVEEYENDRLIRGRYHRKGDSEPISRIEQGRGTATLYDDTGALKERISYLDGKPQITE